MKPHDLQAMTPKTKQMIEANKLFAVQDDDSDNDAATEASVKSKHPRRRYARISVDKDGSVFLHVLGSSEHPPADSYLLKHKDLLKMVDDSNRLAFLELAEEGDYSLGRMLIRLSPNTNFARQFALLCTGETGPSYASTNILKVMYQNDFMESVFFGDYETNNGEGGKAVVVGPDWTTEHENLVYKRNWDAGVVGGWGWEDDRASQFAIHTKSCSGFELPGCFGLVEEGLGILTKALSKQKDITKVYVKDCGILLHRP